jgi:hypothetical protein
MSLPTCIGVYDKRDGGADAHLQFKTWTEILNRPWNSYEEWSSTGGPDWADAEAHLRRLLAEAKRKGRRVLAGALHNTGASVAVAIEAEAAI